MREGWGRIAIKAALLGLVAAGVFSTLASWYVSHPGRGGMQSMRTDVPAQLSSFVDEAGTVTSLESFRGKVVILNLWASWCVPCLQEMPSLDRLAGLLPEDRFAVVAVNQDKGRDHVVRRSFAHLELKRLKLYMEPAGNLTREVGARGMPTTLIVGPDGKPLAFREGAAEWDSAEMIKYLGSVSPFAPERS